MTAHYSTDSAVEAIQKGACDYLTKPLDMEKTSQPHRGFDGGSGKASGGLCTWIKELLDACQFEGWSAVAR